MSNENGQVTMSLYGSAFDANSGESITLADLAGGIRAGRWGKQVGAVRKLLAEAGQEAYDKAKERLPGVTPGGVFHGETNGKGNRRWHGGLSAHSGLCVVDADELSPEEAAQVRDRAAKSPHCALAFISPSERGVKAHMRIALANGAALDADTHPAAYAAVVRHFTALTGVAPCGDEDKQRDVCRLCFVSHDPDAHYNPEAIPLVVEVAEIKRNTSALPAPTATPATTATAYGRKALEDECRKIAETAPTGRNDALNRGAFALGQLIAGGEVPEAEARDGLFRAAEANGWLAEEGPEKTWAVIDSGIGAGKLQPRSAPARTTPSRRVETATAEDLADAHGAHAWRPTELGVAERFAKVNEERVRWCGDMGKWLVYDGTCWQPDDTGETLRLAKRTVLSMYAELPLVENDKARESFRKFIAGCEKDRTLRAILSLAQSELPLPVRMADLDADGWALNVANGLLDLRTGQLQPHRPEHLCMKLAPVDFDPQAQCPRFDAFLHEVMGGNQALMSFLQCAVGASMPAHLREQVLLILYGGGENGKTTFLEIVTRLLGTYTATCEPQTLLARRNDDGVRNDLAALAGARLVATSEPASGRRLNEALVKRLTGGDTITARFLFREFFEFSPTFRCWLLTNHRPEIRETTRAIWRRIRLVPFDVTIPPDRQDKALPEKLGEELPGILNWALAGCLAWQSEGGLSTPEEVAEATASYRDDMDAIGQFIRACCVTGPEKWATAAHLRGEYARWCDDEKEKPVSSVAFGLALRERGFTQSKARVGGKVVRVWQGIGVANHDDEPDR